MATVKICDECGEPRDRILMVVTEKLTGKKYDICSAACLRAHIDRMG